MSARAGVGASPAYGAIAGVSLPQQLRSVGAGWWHNWSLNAPAVVDGAGGEFVPMVWSGNTAGIKAPAGSRWLLGFNEPDSASQADMTLDECARAWRRVEVVNPALKLVAPAPTADIRGWRDDWVEVYRRLWGEDPRFDAVAVHVYPQKWGYFEECIAAAWQFARRYGVRLWVTEYAFLPCWAPAPGDAVAMLKRMTTYMARDPARFDRWAPFILTCSGREKWAFGEECNSSLVDYYTGQLTELGRGYLECRPGCLPRALRALGFGQ